MNHLSEQARPAVPTDPATSSVSPPWTRERAAELYAQPFADLLYQAQTVHRQNFNPNRVQKSTLLNIKTGGCPEDCKYCSQSAHYTTGLDASRLMAVDAVLEDAARAKSEGATRYCMGAAWREVKDRDLDQVCAMVEGVKALGLETCMTLGMLDDGAAVRLKSAGLDYYNHNIDTSEENYRNIITTRTFQDRLDTLSRVRDAGIKVCCGGILGLGETADDRLSMLVTLANLDPAPESVPINMLVPIPGTPLEGVEAVDPLDFVRTIAVARIMMPGCYLRLSAGRREMSDETQAMCFLAGANSIFSGDRLLTTDNPGEARDRALFAKLGLETLTLDDTDESGESEESLEGAAAGRTHEP